MKTSKYLLFAGLCFCFAGPAWAADYSKIDTNGVVVLDDTTSWSCVLDNETGLIWEKKRNDEDVQNNWTTYSLDEAVTFSQQVNQDGLCGYNDWRLPEVWELQKLVDYELHAPAIDLLYFSGTPYDERGYWTATMHPDGSSTAWTVSFWTGFAELGWYVSSPYRVRLVRGGSSLQPFDFIKLDSAGNEVSETENDWSCIRDNRTGLIWEKKTSANKDSLYGWDRLPLYVDEINSVGLCGASDWRVPELVEMIGLVTFDIYDSAISNQYFPNTLSDYYWTATEYHYNLDNEAWALNFYQGADYGIKKSQTKTVRLVSGSKLTKDISVPDITANGFDGSLSISSGQSLQVAISLDAGDAGGEVADWFITATSPMGNYYYSYPDGWKAGSRYNAAYTGGLFRLQDFTVLEISSLPLGEYDFEFRIELENRKKYADSVEVSIL